MKTLTKLRLEPTRHGLALNKAKLVLEKLDSFAKLSGK